MTLKVVMFIGINLFFDTFCFSTVFANRVKLSLTAQRQMERIEKRQATKNCDRFIQCFNLHHLTWQFKKLSIGLLKTMKRAGNKK